MSIESQLSELKRAFADQSDVTILKVFTEAKSAKAPGRPIFNEMMDQVEKGVADGVVAWAPDRLARNSIDGGRIIYGLDTGRVKNLKFVTYTFENNSNGKFMLSIMFSQSKYYSDALGDNVRRGLTTKVDHGWRPGRLPIGYRMDPVTKQIVTDPVHFPLVRRMFQLVLSGERTAREVATLARDDWGFRMPLNRQSFGGPISVAHVYRLLKNPFYAGVFRWAGETRRGSHEPVISLPDFDRVRRIINRSEKPKPQKHRFPFTGLIRCGACARMITAERKVKPSGRTYVYYRCTRRGFGSRCNEQPVPATELEAQFLQFLSAVTIPPLIEAELQKGLGSARSSEHELSVARTASLKRARADIDREQEQLLQMRMRNLVSDIEFVRERDRLANERLRTDDALSKAEDPSQVIELAQEVVSFSKYAIKSFKAGDEVHKREILRIVGTDPTLKSKKLSIQAAKPFIVDPKIKSIRKMCGNGNDVRTRSQKDTAKAWVQDLIQWIDEEPERAQALRNTVVRMMADIVQ